MKYLLTTMIILVAASLILKTLQVDKEIKFRYNPTLSEEYIISQEKNLINKILKQVK